MTICRQTLIALILTALLASVSMYQACSHAEKLPSSRRLTVVFTGDDRGSVKRSCGCGGKEVLGGLAPRATWLKRLRESGEDFLLLDIGDTIAGTGPLAEIKSRAYAKALPLMDYDAVGLGEWEAHLSKAGGRPDPYGSVPLVCANVVESSTGSPLTQKPWHIKETASGLRVGIVSVLGEGMISRSTQEELGIRILPVRETAEECARELEGRCDLLVLLSHTGTQESRKLASELQGYDVILSGHSMTSDAQKPERLVAGC